MNLFDSGIRPAVDAWLLAKSKEVRSYGDYWSASSAGYCMRKVIFERLKVPYVTEDARKQRVFSSGHIFHEWIQDITKQSGLSIAQELELQDEELMIRGHIDDLVLVKAAVPFGPEPEDAPLSYEPEEDHLILYDYKTKHSKWFEYAKGRPMNHYYRMQLATYMYMLRKGNFKPFDTEWGDWKAMELTEARLLHISKDDLRLYEEQLLWSPELEKEVYEYWSTLNGYWKNRTIPKCTCADYENGFMSKPQWNPFYYNDQPCSLAWYNKWKSEQKA